MSILAELRRRNVFQVATGYALVAWMLIEAGSVLLPTFGASARVFRAYTIIIIAGFVVAIVVDGPDFGEIRRWFQRALHLWRGRDSGAGHGA